MKKIVVLLSFVLLSVSALAQPKYVFYFIGDGMGVNQVNMTENYLAAIKGELGIEPLAFTQFPVASVANTYSANNGVTDSAASGTALATGSKTNNGAIGVDKNGERLTNIAEMAKANGKKVGVVTTVTINHATPAAFSAHQLNRGMGYEIAKDQIANGFDFYGGAGFFNEDTDKDGKKLAPIKPQFEAAGYTICNYEQFNAGYKDMQKVLMVPGEGQKVAYAIDARNGAPEEFLTLKELVESAVTFLMKDNKKGFFLMAEGGEIDHGCHSNDAASTIHEIIDFDEAIKVAIDFYKKYPKQTLIVITADHETGGLVFTPGSAKDLSKLSFQKSSMNVISEALKNQMVKNKAIMTWEEVKNFLGEQLGLWKSVSVSWEQEKMLRDIYEDTIAKRDAGSEKDLYADNAKIVSAAVKVLDSRAHVSWVTSGHSAGYTPVYAMGVGSELFTHKMNNIEIPMLVKQAAAYK